MKLVLQLLKKQLTIIPNHPNLRIMDLKLANNLEK
jgi:hypothetical protein